MGVPYFLYGEGAKITPDMIPDVSKQPEVVEAAKNAGKLLGNRLREGHDREQVTRKMQKIMMELFKEST